MMNIDRPNVLISMIMGVTLSSLLFYPLFSELHDNIFYLQWRQINTVELFCVFFLFTLLTALIFYFIYKCKNIHIKLFLLLAIIFIPFMLFCIYFLKQLFRGNSIVISVCNLIFNQHKPISLLLIAVLVTIVVLMFARYPRRIVQMVILILVAIIPINVLSIWSGIKACSSDTVIRMDNRKDSEQILNYYKPSDNVLIILFDELSYYYIYNHGKVNQRYKNIEGLSLISDNYHKALSPGNDTFTAIPGLILGKKLEKNEAKYNHIYSITQKRKAVPLVIDSNNLFAYAKGVGYTTFCFGPYLNYCELFGEWLNGGRSFSIYNYGSLTEGFKLYNPLLTTIMLLPHQFPYGLLKDPVCSLWQKNVTEQTYTLTIEAINSPEPFFIFAHFYFTHVPFVFDRNGYYKNNKPFLKNDENYRKQLDYADKLLGDLIAELKRNNKFNDTIVIITSDHNYRVMGSAIEKDVPLIIKHKNQKTCNDTYDSVGMEKVLRKELFGF